MANEEQLAILRQGVRTWNGWRKSNPNIKIDLTETDLRQANLRGISFKTADLSGVKLKEADISNADLSNAVLKMASLSGAYLIGSNLSGADFGNANLIGAFLCGAILYETNFSQALIGMTNFGDLDMGKVQGLDNVKHYGPSTIGTDTLILSRGRISALFMRGCGLSDWEIEQANLYNPDLSNEEINRILYRLYDLRAHRALQISPLFISYSHGDVEFVDKIGEFLAQKGIRYWRDIHDMKAGRIEKQIDQAISQDRTVLLVLSENSLKSDWVEHEVRKAREIGRNAGRDTLCPVALDDSWKKSPWPARVMEQIMEFHILDFAEWKDHKKFDSMFRKLIDGLELFYKR